MHKSSREERVNHKRWKDTLEKDIVVFKEILNDPLQTNVSIAKKIWVSKMNITERINKFKRMWYKSPTIESICDNDIQNVKLWQEILTQRLQNNPDDLSVNEIVNIIAEGTKRYTIFKWKLTDKDGWLKNVLELPMEQLRERLQELRDKEENILKHNWRENVIEMTEWEGDIREGADKKAISRNELAWQELQAE